MNILPGIFLFLATWTLEAEAKLPNMRDLVKVRGRSLLARNTGKIPKTILRNYFDGELCNCSLDQIIRRMDRMKLPLNYIEKIPNTTIYTGIDYYIYSTQYPGYRWVMHTKTFEPGRTTGFIMLESPEEQFDCDPCAEFRLFRNFDGSRTYLLNKCGNGSDYEALVMPYNAGCLADEEGRVGISYAEVSKKDNFKCLIPAEPNIYCWEEDKKRQLDMAVVQKRHLFYFGFNSVDGPDKDLKKYIYTPGLSNLGPRSYLQFLETKKFRLGQKNFGHEVKAVCGCRSV